MKNNHRLFKQLKSLSTERRNLRSRKFDILPVLEILKVINSEDQKIARVVKKEIPFIAEAVELIVGAFQKNGRFIYVGAGTSGRLGILDASECPPTYGTNPEMVKGIIAGGNKAVFQSQEGAEDNEVAGIKAIRSIKIGHYDVVCGIAASARTPFVVGAIKEAKRRGAKTIYVTTNSRSFLKKKDFASLYKTIDVAICPEVGPEVIMGSTRMKSGTAQKMVLNMLTTTAMIRIGKVYENMMVDLKINSRKLEERAKRILMIATGIDYDKADKLLSSADGHVKTAIVMAKAKVSASEARKRLKRSNGFVKQAIR